MLTEIQEILMDVELHLLEKKSLKESRLWFLLKYKEEVGGRQVIINNLLNKTNLQKLRYRCESKIIQAKEDYEGPGWWHNRKI